MIKTEDRRFMHLKKKIAVFAVVALAAIAGAVLLIGKEHDLFTKKYELEFTADKGTGFNRGMPVKLSGFRIGRIKSISLNEAATVDIVLQIDKQYQKWITKDSTAKLVKEGLVGDAIIEVSVGTRSLPVMQDKDKLAYVKTKALDELAEEIADKVKPVLSEVSDIIAYVNDPQGDVKQAMKSLKVLSGNLEQTRQRADSLLVRAGDEVGGVSAKLNTVLEDASTAVRKANTSLGLMDEKLPGLLTSAESSLDNVNKISNDLKLVEEKVLPGLPSLMRKSDATLDGAGTVLQAVQGIWPISGNIPAPRENQFVPGDSHD